LKVPGKERRDRLSQLPVKSWGQSERKLVSHVNRERVNVVVPKIRVQCWEGGRELT
jgi:hypothetical protein